MPFDPGLAWLVSVALLTVRLLFAVALTPALSSYSVPSVVRVALTAALALTVYASRAPLAGAREWLVDPLNLVAPLMAEVFVGSLLGLGVHVVLAAFAIAGRLLDVQIGFGIGSIFDPSSRSNSNVLGALIGLLGVTLFFVTDSHLALVQLVARSVDVLPLGRIPPFDDPMRCLRAAGAMFAVGIALAAPVAMALFLTDLAIGVASRNMPQVNVLVLAIPVKVIVGYFVLSISVAGWTSIMRQGYDGMTASLGLR